MGDANRGLTVGTKYRTSKDEISYLTMPDVDQIAGAVQPKRLGRRGQRNARRLAMVKLDWRGKGLRALHDYELRLREDFDRAEGDYSARCSIVRTFCALLDTRRILVGDPLPGTLRPSKQTTLEAWREAAVPALPCPVSISAPQATGEKPPEFAHTQSVQSAESSANTLDAENSWSGS